MNGIETIRAINSWAKSHHYAEFAKSLNKGGGHAKDEEKGRPQKTKKSSALTRGTDRASFH